MLNNSKIIFCFSNTWLHIATAFKSFSFNYSAFHNKFPAFSFTLFNRIQVHLHRIFINNRANMILFI